MVLAGAVVRVCLCPCFASAVFQCFVRGCSNGAGSKAMLLVVFSLCIPIACLFDTFLQFIGFSVTTTVRDQRSASNQIADFVAFASHFSSCALHSLGLNQMCSGPNYQAIKLVCPEHNFSFLVQKFFY